MSRTFADRPPPWIRRQTSPARGYAYLRHEALGLREFSASARVVERKKDQQRLRGTDVPPSFGSV